MGAMDQLTVNSEEAMVEAMVEALVQAMVQFTVNSANQYFGLLLLPSL